jgi:hypothetical protein
MSNPPSAANVTSRWRKSEAHSTPYSRNGYTWRRARSEYLRRKAIFSNRGSVIASELASSKVRTTSHCLPSLFWRVRFIEPPSRETAQSLSCICRCPLLPSLAGLQVPQLPRVHSVLLSIALRSMSAST